MTEQKSEALQNTRNIVLLALFCCLLWGSATPVIKIGYSLFRIESADTMSLILFAGVRFFFASIITLVLGSIIRGRILVPKKSSWGIVTVQGLVQTVIQYSLYFIGLANTVGAKGSITSGTNSFFSVLIAGLIFKMEKITPRKIFGCIIGFIGIIVLNITNSFEFSFKLIGEGALIVSAISYSASSVLMKRFSSREDPITLTGWQFVIGSLIMIGIALIGGGKLSPVSSSAWLLMAFLSLAASVAYTIWSLLLKNNDVSKITVYTLSIPVFGVVLSLIFLSEKINPVQYSIALVLVCLGIYLVNSHKKRQVSIT